MKKRVIAAMLAGIMVFSVTACGKDESTGSSDTQTTGGTEESSADTEAAADTADAADTESEEAEQPAAPVEIVVTTLVLNVSSELAEVSATVLPVCSSHAFTPSL